MDYFFLFPARVLGPASDGGGGEGGGATTDDEASDDLYLDVKRRDGKVFEQSMKNNNSEKE